MSDRAQKRSQGQQAKGPGPQACFPGFTLPNLQQIKEAAQGPQSQDGIGDCGCLLGGNVYELDGGSSKIDRRRLLQDRIM